MSCDDGVALVLWTATGYGGRAVERAILETLGQIGTPEMERRLDVAQAWARAQDINLHVEDIVDVYHKAVYAKKGIVV